MSTWFWRLVVTLTTLTPRFVRAEATSQGVSAFDRVTNNLGTLEDRVLGNATVKPPEVIVADLISIALSLLGIVFVILIIYGGYLWMTARGNDEQVLRARSLVIQSVIGVCIVLLAYFITAFVIQRVGEAVFEDTFFF